MPERDLSPTVYGIETEYSLMMTLPGNIVHELVGSCHSVDVKLGLYQQPSKKGMDDVSSLALADAIAANGLQQNGSGMLSNGGRFYIDPSGPEYATPETRTAEEAVHRSFDGDEIMLGILKKLRESGIIEEAQLNRRIVDHNGTSRGVHVNTMSIFSPETEVPTEVVECLGMLNVVKGAIFGSGGLLVNAGGQTEFHYSPRLSLTNAVSTPYSSYTSRPLVRVPFKEDGKHSRIETVTSDALNFAWPLRASLVFTNAVTNLIELGYGSNLPLLRDPVKAARVVGLYGNTNQIAVINGESFKGKRPTDIIRQICELVLNVDDKLEHLDSESEQVINEILEVSDKMSKDESSVAGQVEAVARRIAFKKKMDKDNISIGSERMCRFDYAWDWLGGGIAEKIRKDNIAGWKGFSSGYSKKTTNARLVTPPGDTRAKIRAGLIMQGDGRRLIDWSQVSNSSDEDGITYMHPYEIKL